MFPGCGSADDAVTPFPECIGELDLLERVPDATTVDGVDPVFVDVSTACGNQKVMPPARIELAHAVVEAAYLQRTKSRRDNEEPHERGMDIAARRPTPACCARRAGSGSFRVRSRNVGRPGGGGPPRRLRERDGACAGQILGVEQHFGSVALAAVAGDDPDERQADADLPGDALVELCPVGDGCRGRNGASGRAVRLVDRNDALLAAALKAVRLILNVPFCSVIWE